MKWISAHRVMALAFAMAASLAACAALAADSAHTTTFIIVRHAEKQSVAAPDTALNLDDPALTAAGQRRAAALALALADSKVYAVYATPYERTRATAQPTAKNHGLPITRYAPTADAGAFIAQLKADKKPGTVLIVGHSNTVPAMVAAMCQCPAPALTDQDYGDRFDIVVDSDGSSTLAHLRY